MSLFVLACGNEPAVNAQTIKGNFLNKVIKNPINKDISTINIASADDLWDYFSRFSVNNQILFG